MHRETRVYANQSEFYALSGCWPVYHSSAYPLASLSNRPVLFAVFFWLCLALV